MSVQDGKHDFDDIRKAAEKQFGKVVRIARSLREEGPVHILCCRNDPALPDKPFMTIQVDRNNGNGVGFSHGHYDMTEREAREDLDIRGGYTRPRQQHRIKLGGP